MIEGFGFRHVQVVLIFLCLTITYAERVNMSVAIVAMTDKNTNPDFPEYSWGEREKSLVLSSFFWGYVVTQIPGGQLAKKVGGKVMLLVAILLCSLLNLLTPKFAEFGDWPAVAALRVVQGLCQGVIFPSTHTLLAKWAPPSERGELNVKRAQLKWEKCKIDCFFILCMLCQARSELIVILVRSSELL